MLTLERDFGALEARMETVESELQSISRDVREIRDTLAGIRGGWKVLTVLIGLSASLGAAAVKLVEMSVHSSAN